MTGAAAIGGALRTAALAGALALTLPGGSAVAGEAYRWVDAQGVTHFSQFRPAPPIRFERLHWAAPAQRRHTSAEDVVASIERRLRRLEALDDGSQPGRSDAPTRVPPANTAPAAAEADAPEIAILLPPIPPHYFPAYPHGPRIGRPHTRRFPRCDFASNHGRGFGRATPTRLPTARATPLAHGGAFHGAPGGR